MVARGVIWMVVFCHKKLYMKDFIKFLAGLQMWLINFIGFDRITHFAFGGWLACIAPTWLYALIIGFCIGMIKELADKYIKKSKFDLYDLLATFLGSVLTAIYLIII